MVFHWSIRKFVTNEQKKSRACHLSFNSGKFYGRVQLANLFTNWKQVPEDYDYYDTMKFEVVENKVILSMIIIVISIIIVNP